MIFSKSGFGAPSVDAFCTMWTGGAIEVDERAMQWTDGGWGGREKRSAAVAATAAVQMTTNRRHDLPPPDRSNDSLINNAKRRTKTKNLSPKRRLSLRLQHSAERPTTVGGARTRQCQDILISMLSTINESILNQIKSSNNMVPPYSSSSSNNNNWTTTMLI